MLQLLRHDKDSPLGHHPLWCRPGLVDAGLVSEFRREARVVHKGMEGDLNKVRGGVSTAVSRVHSFCLLVHLAIHQTPGMAATRQCWGCLG